jgi:cytochrome c oxidase accessory protein FixG
MDKPHPSPSAEPPKSSGGGEGLYASTPRIHPRRVQGLFRTLKWWLMLPFLGFWYVAPFLRWDRGPDAPHQAILIDMAARRAYFFFIEIWPQEVYYLTGLLVMAGIALFLMSALAGRVWCGFMCWQTTYTDLFVAVERWIIGERGARIRFDQRKWDFDKLWRTAAVNGVWVLIAAATGIAFVLYFGDAYTMLPQILSGHGTASNYTFIAIVGGGCLLMAGYAREQVCIYMCPYARFQSAMFDEHSLIVSYEAWRGEPRGPTKKGQSFEGRGHCIDCSACVQACPTGIDIRNGSQLACIGCGLCIDACNTIMDRIGLPRGLITYDSTYNQQARATGGVPKIRLVRTRTVIYALALAFVGAVMLYALSSRVTISAAVLHERSPLYVVLSHEQTVRNGYTYKVLNKQRKARHFYLDVAGVKDARLEVIGDEGQARPEIDVGPDTEVSYRVYVTAPRASARGASTPITFVLTDSKDHSVVRTRNFFLAPHRHRP